MWYILGILCCIVRVHATCSNCCRPGGVCDAAYKGGPGICCGGGSCCPRGALCVQCDHGVTRCAYPPYTGCPQHFETERGITFVLFLIVCTCAFNACLWRSHYHHSSAVTSSDGFATGLIGGVLLSDALHDHSPEPEPPSYVEATFESDA